MLDQIRAISLQTQQAQVPAQFLYATVSAVEPLTVQVDNRFYLTAPALVTMAPHTHITEQQTTGSTFVSTSSHTHTVPQQETAVNVLYTVGDSVVLLRNAGGQTYLLLGRAAT